MARPGRACCCRRRPSTRGSPRWHATHGFIVRRMIGRRLKGPTVDRYRTRSPANLDDPRIRDRRHPRTTRAFSAGCPIILISGKRIALRIRHETWSGLRQRGTNRPRCIAFGRSRLSGCAKCVPTDRAGPSESPSAPICRVSLQICNNRAVRFGERAAHASRLQQLSQLPAYSNFPIAAFGRDHVGDLQNGLSDRPAADNLTVPLSVDRAGDPPGPGDKAEQPLPIRLEIPGAIPRGLSHRRRPPTARPGAGGRADARPRLGLPERHAFGRDEADAR